MASCECAAGEVEEVEVAGPLECPVCWESFDARAKTPYVLWCGHSLCRACVLALPWATVGAQLLQLPLFVACPWCQFLTLRLRWKGRLRHPCKNFFLLWIVDTQEQEARIISSHDTEPMPDVFHHLLSPRTPPPPPRPPPVVNAPSSRLASFVARIPLVLLLLFLVVYVLPLSALVLALYCFVTVAFALPSFLVVYFSYPSLDWLMRAIAS